MARKRKAQPAPAEDSQEHETPIRIGAEKIASNQWEVSLQVEPGPVFKEKFIEPSGIDPGRRTVLFGRALKSLAKSYETWGTNAGYERDRRIDEEESA